MRPVDADALMAKLNRKKAGPANQRYTAGFNDCLMRVRSMVHSAPTLTPQNETPPCYQPDGDGCAYQCYDGDDEPIDKCKECSLCYSDKQRHHAPPNEPLTCEQLREMDSIPIWVVDTTINRREWCYWKGGLAYSCEAHPEYYDPDEYGLWLAYRRPPEGEEDT